ncbi:MAG: outer membrane lipoprotein carrier protein LolA [Spirochaetaceae bacterium]|jgi:outer membrane lipoprotein-sorting protein|nr:outer membrane lipoprotein carrier protein LolA [Spirochaetaceae bacterium]
MKKIYISVIILLAATLAQAQDILTAGAFFKTISDYYGTISDYQAQMDITVGRSAMSGRVSFKRPELLRIDFTTPKDQVIVYNGEMLTIYLPDRAAALNQASSPAGRGGALATAQGLNLLSRYYTIVYETGQDPVSLDANSPELVVKLILSRRTNSEEFRTIRLSVSPDTRLIRRVEATTTKGELFVFSFSSYVINQGIADQRFIYDTPVSANEYNDFLFAE